MNLKKSFFNKSLFKSDMKRFWWLSLLETFFIMIITVIPVYERIKWAFGLEMRTYEPTWFTGAIAVIIIFSVGVAVLLFNYMHFTAPVSTLHSIPAKRSTLFLTKLTSGAVLTFIPIIINAVILACIFINPEYSEYISLAAVGKWALSGIIYTAVVFSLTCIINMMTGNPIGTIVFTVGFGILPLIIIGTFHSFFGMEIYGYWVDEVDNLLTHIYIYEKELLTMPYILIYPIMTAVFLIGAYLLYKYRKLESYGEVITFSWLKPVFITIIGVLTSMMSYFYFTGVLNKNGVFWLLPFGVIGTVIAWMISRKSIRLNGILKPLTIYIIAALSFIAIIKFDLTGFERRVPDISKIEKVKITYDRRREMTWYTDDQEIKYWRKGEISPYFTEVKDIKNVITLHERLIDNKGESVSWGEDIPIEYVLKNGKTLKRRYTADFKKDADVLAPLYETPQRRANGYAIVNGAEREYIYVMVDDRRFTNGTLRTIYPDNEYMLKLTEALKQDIEAISYEDMISQNSASLALRLEYKYTYESDTDLSDIVDEFGNESDRYVIRPNFKNTVAVLTEMGVYEALPKATDIKTANVYTWNRKNDDKPMVEVTKSGEQVGIDVTDPEKIAVLYSMYDKMIEEKNFTNYETCENIEINYTLNNGHTFAVSCSYDADKIPVEIREYFN